MPFPDGVTSVVTLQRGETFGLDSNDAMIGHEMTADHPIGILSFGPTTTIPWDFPNGPEPDAAQRFEQSVPVRVWGSEYVAVRHRDRWEGLPEQPPWRIIGALDDTMLSYAPYRPAGAPDRINRGELSVFYADEPFIVKSQDEQHTFFFSGHMTGPRYQKQRYGSRGYDEDVRGRPLIVAQLATQRWAKRYSFFASTVFPEHSVVVIRRVGAKDVRLDCAGSLEGWQSIGSQYEFARVALTGQLFEPIDYPAGRCDAGLHQVESDDPFWATVWGWGSPDTGAALGIGSDQAYGLPLFGADESSLRPTR